jgi:hypothetical protein
MKVLKLALALAILGAAAGPNSKAQVVNQSTSVNKTKISGSVEKDTTAPEYYELRCRGGVTYVDGQYGIPVAQQLEFISWGSWTKEGSNERMINLLVNFLPGTEPVNLTGSNLDVGQCSWLDRGFRPAEPNQIRLEIIYVGQQKPIDRSPTAAEQYPDSMNVPEYMKDPDHYWSFFVKPGKNEWGGPIFVATSSHYWKPPRIDQEIRTPRSKVPAEVKKPTQ